MFIYIPIKISSRKTPNVSGRNLEPDQAQRTPKEGNTGRIRIRIMVRIGEVQGRVIVGGEIWFKFQEGRA